VGRRVGGDSLIAESKEEYRDEKSRDSPERNQSGGNLRGSYLFEEKRRQIDDGETTPNIL
jgi:hypothetical protein